MSGMVYFYAPYLSKAKPMDSCKHWFTGPFSFLFSRCQENGKAVFEGTDRQGGISFSVTDIRCGMLVVCIPGVDGGNDRDQGIAVALQFFLVGAVVGNLFGIKRRKRPAYSQSWHSSMNPGLELCEEI